jgi:hypothetical protein
MEGHFVGLFVWIAVLFYMSTIPRKNREWRAAHTQLDYERRRSKWHYWPIVAFTLLFAVMIALFAIYEVVVIVQMLWIEK